MRRHAIRRLLRMVAAVDREIQRQILKRSRVRRVIALLLAYLSVLSLIVYGCDDNPAIVSFAALVGFALLTLLIRWWSFLLLPLIGWLVIAPHDTSRILELLTAAILGFMLSVAVHKYRQSVRLEKSVHAQRDALRALMDQLPVGIAVMNASNCVTTWSDGATRLTGRSEAQVLGKPCFEALGCCGTRGGAPRPCNLLSPRPSDRLVPATRLQVCAADGTDIAVEPTVGALRDAQGSRTGSIVILRDLREQLRLEKEREAHVERLAQELTLARHVQERLLEPPAPCILLEAGGVEVRLDAFSAPHSEVGGDFYHTYQRGSSFYLIVGDVQGKGVGAALIMAVAVTLFESAVRRVSTPSAILRRMNERMCATMGGGADLFVTALVVQVDAMKRAYRVSRAGHEMALLLHQGHCSPVPQQVGLPLGIQLGESYPEETFPLGRDDCLLVYTDGLLELQPPTISADVLRRMLERLPHGTAEEARTSIMRMLPQPLVARDDVTFVAMSVTCPGNIRENPTQTAEPESSVVHGGQL